MTVAMPLAGSVMGDLQTYAWLVVEGATVVAIMLIVTLVASVELARMWRSGERSLIFTITAGGVFVGLAFIVIATVGVTLGVLHSHGS